MRIQLDVKCICIAGSKRDAISHVCKTTCVHACGQKCVAASDVHVPTCEVGNSLETSDLTSRRYLDCLIRYSKQFPLIQSSPLGLKIVVVKID